MNGQVAVFVKLPNTESAVIAAQEATDDLRYNAEEFHFGREHDANVPGAKAARRGTYTYAEVSSGELTGRTVRGTDVTMVDKDSNAVLVRITGIKGKLKDHTVDQIVNSIEMK